MPSSEAEKAVMSCDLTVGSNDGIPSPRRGGLRIILGLSKEPRIYSKSHLAKRLFQTT